MIGKHVFGKGGVCANLQSIHALILSGLDIEPEIGNNKAEEGKILQQLEIGKWATVDCANGSQEHRLENQEEVQPLTILVILV